MNLVGWWTWSNFCQFCFLLETNLFDPIGRFAINISWPRHRLKHTTWLWNISKYIEQIDQKWPCKWNHTHRIARKPQHSQYITPSQPSILSTFLLPTHPSLLTQHSEYTIKHTKHNRMEWVWEEKGWGCQWEGFAWQTEGTKGSIGDVGENNVKVEVNIK